METQDFGGNGNKGGLTAVFVLGGLVYLGVILVNIAMSGMYFTDSLPVDAYFLRGLMWVSVACVGMSATGLPLALHFWAVSGFHRALAYVWYAVDVFIMAVNFTVSFSTLRGTPPAWVSWYEPYAMSMITFALIAWGSLAVFAPGERANLKLRQAKEEFRLRAFSRAAAYLDSVEGKQAIAVAAGNLIPLLFDANQTTPAARSWYQKNDSDTAKNDSGAAVGSESFLSRQSEPMPVKSSGNGHH